MKLSKRKTLAAIATTTVVSSKWTKPVVDSVILPVHAEMTAGGGDPTTGTTMAPTTVPPSTTGCVSNPDANIFCKLVSTDVNLKKIS